MYRPGAIPEAPTTLVPELKLPGIVVEVVVAGIVVFVVAGTVDVVVAGVRETVGCVTSVGEASLTFCQVSRPRDRTHLRVADPTRRTCPTFRHRWPGLIELGPSNDAAETIWFEPIDSAIPSVAIASMNTKNATPLILVGDCFIL